MQRVQCAVRFDSQQSRIAGPPQTNTSLTAGAWSGAPVDQDYPRTAGCSASFLVEDLSVMMVMVMMIGGFRGAA